MRLRRWIAAELLVGAGLAASAGVAVSWSIDRLYDEFSREARAAELREDVAPRPIVPREVTPPTELRIVAQPPTGTFLGVADDVLLAPLHDSPVTRVKFNKGGTSISLRLDFENGARAAFKPEQSNLQSVPRREIAAFRVNRLIGLSSVPPAVGGRFLMSDLLAVLHPESRGYAPRLRAEMIQEDGWVSGELSWWIPEIDRGHVGGYELDSMEGIVTWKRYLSAGESIPDADLVLTRQISNMVLFDFLINNPDRWSGGNARVSEDRRLLYFMDNTLSFGANPHGGTKSRLYFERCQKFSRALVERLRGLEETELRRVLSRDQEPYDYLLRDEEISALMSRRDLALQYIDDLVAQHGADAVLSFP